MLNQISFLPPVKKDHEQINIFKAQKDQYYNYLMKKYNCYDEEEIINIITDTENKIREELELKAMFGA